jgi:hypothetical protein
MSIDLNVIIERKSLCIAHNETTTVETSSDETAQLPCKRKVTKKTYQGYVSGE